MILQSQRLTIFLMKHEIVLSEKQIKTITKNIGTALTERLKNEKMPPVFLCVMKGALPFFFDVIKNVKLTMICDFIQLSSYEKTASTGEVIIKKNFEADINGRSVVIIEDIVDTGLSMKFLINYINKNYKPKQVILVSLLDKQCTRKVDVKVDYTGKVLTKSDFLMGYGLDYCEFDRNVPYVYIAQKEDVKYWDSLLK